MRGYFGIGVLDGKNTENVGGLWRSAHAFGASMIFTIGFRARCQPSDVSRAARHVPLLQFANLDDFLAHVPENCKLVGVETDHSRTLPSYCHPSSALYLLGAEDRGLSGPAISACLSSGGIVSIPSALCLNVATAGSIVMYDRVAKASK